MPGFLASYDIFKTKEGFRVAKIDERELRRRCAGRPQRCHPPAKLTRNAVNNGQIRTDPDTDRPERPPDPRRFAPGARPYKTRK